MTGREIYIASRWDRQEEMRTYRHELRRRGHVVQATWLDQADNLPMDKLGNHDVRLRAAQHAMTDMHDIQSCNLFITFTGGAGTGGRHIETGLALWMGKEVMIVGPVENIFHCLPQVTWFPDWRSFIRDAGMGHPQHGRTSTSCPWERAYDDAH